MFGEPSVKGAWNCKGTRFCDEQSSVWLMAWGSKSRQERGYGKEWTRVRKVVLERDCGLCQPCKRKGKYTPATEVDHIVSKANAGRLKWTQEQIDAESNLQAICNPCHLVKSEEEQGKQKRPKVRIGVDGFPVE